MVSAALRPNLANVSMAFALCSALCIRMVLPVIFCPRISTAVPLLAANGRCTLNKERTYMHAKDLCRACGFAYRIREAPEFSGQY